MKKKEELEKNLIELQQNMLNFAISLTTNRDEAQSLVQETTLRALANLEKYDVSVNFKGWVFTIMHNIFVNNYAPNISSRPIVDPTENLYHLNLPQEAGFDTPEGSYTITEINEILNNFHNEYRMPFTMHVNGYKYEEIAKELNLPLGTVKSRIFFTRKKLQEILKDRK